jgi:hypothetical protein
VGKRSSLVLVDFIGSRRTLLVVSDDRSIADVVADIVSYADEWEWLISEAVERHATGAHDVDHAE